MGQYLFHVRDEGHASATTEIGFPTLKDAKCSAVRFAGEVIRDRSDEFWESGDIEITVTDMTGLTLFSMRFIGTEAPAIQRQVPKSMC